MPVIGCGCLAEVTFQVRPGLSGGSTSGAGVMSEGWSVQPSQCPWFNNSCSPNLESSLKIISIEKQISNCGKEREIFCIFFLKNLKIQWEQSLNSGPKVIHLCINSYFHPLCRISQPQHCWHVGLGNACFRELAVLCMAECLVESLAPNFDMPVQPSTQCDSKIY